MVSALCLLDFQGQQRTCSINYSEVQTKIVITDGEKVWKIDHECDYPFSTESFLVVLLFFKDGIHYISTGEKRCAWHFAKELENKVRDAIFLPSYFKEKFLQKIRKAKQRFDNI